jgi:leucyl/phenylalanyl-tRNA--protein transferase
MSKRYAFSPETLIKAYSLGVFPMADGARSNTINFYDPKVRALIPVTVGTESRQRFHIPKRLRRTVKQARFIVTIDRDFPAVIAECAAPRPDREDTWINSDIKRLYIALHKLGFAHSIEVWDGDRLVGGLYGVALRSAFFGESMFSRATDASKVALVHLVARLRAGGFQLLDAQFTTDHLQQFGIFEMPREQFQQSLAVALASHASILPGEPDKSMVAALLAAIQSADQPH